MLAFWIAFLLFFVCPVGFLWFVAWRSREEFFDDSGPDMGSQDIDQRYREKR